jgi:hypothetical protein
MGFVYVNATRPAVVFVRSLLREKLRQLQLSSVRYYNDQRHMNQVLVEVSRLCLLWWVCRRSDLKGQWCLSAGSELVWGFGA